MDPNSAHQVWSMWAWTVTPDQTVNRPLFENIRSNLARFGKKAFGSASQMRITERIEDYLVEVMTEGHPVQDEKYVRFMDAQWQQFFKNGFGWGTEVQLTTKLLAGSPENGRPPDQLIILPALEMPHHG